MAAKRGVPAFYMNQVGGNDDPVFYAREDDLVVVHLETTPL
jgi:hypothetical protein